MPDESKGLDDAASLRQHAADRHDEQDAPPTRPGQAAEPKWYVTLAVMPDGTFACDGNCMNDEMIVRALLHKGSFEIDRWFGKRAFEKAMSHAQENQVLTSMMGREKKRIDRRIIG